MLFNPLSAAVEAITMATLTTTIIIIMVVVVIIVAATTVGLRQLE